MATHVTIYQKIHTLNGEIFHLEAHLKLLREAYRDIYGKVVKLPIESVQKLLEDAMAANRCPRDISLFVTLTLNPAGILAACELTRSIYRGYTLRCISPSAAIIEFHIPYFNHCTTLRAEIIEWANTIAQRQGADLALRSFNGQVGMIDGAQTFAVTDSEIITSPVSFSVEHSLAKRVAKTLDLRLVERALLPHDIPNLEELFFVDHYGVTAIKSCHGRVFMSITAETVAKRMNDL